jgi:hypothetical protein
MPCPCQAVEPQYRYAPEFRGVDGLLDQAAIQSATTGTGLGLSAVALGQGALSGAIIGGLAAGSMKGAGTGALLAGGLGGAFAGGALLLASSANAELRAGGILGLVAGLAFLGLGASRSYATIKGR